MMLLLSELTLYYFDVFHSFDRRSESFISSERTRVGKWAKSVAAKSQLKPSVPPSACSDLEWVDNDINDDAPEDLDFNDNLTKRHSAKGVVHILEAINDAPRGKKRTLSTVSVEEPGPEEQCEMQEDPEADEDAEYQDAEGDVPMTDEGGDVEVRETTTSRLTTSMSVSVVETDNRNKFIKTETGRAPRNSQWCLKFIPTIMYWVGNSRFPWIISDDTLSNILYDINYSVYKQPGDFEVDGCNGAFNVVYQRISEWRGNFGSTAITILMAFFASTDEYETQEARKAYSEYQLEDFRFVYEDPDSEDSPGAFLSEFILRIFATHLDAIHGRQTVDSLDFGLPTYQTALALTTAAAERAFILARDDLIVEDNSEHGKHRLALTLNQATNKMSNTGTAFSAGNWETDTLAYMERIEELPFDRVKEIVERSQLYMKCSRHKDQDEDTIPDDESQVPVNPRSRIHICIFFSLS
ncbi:uncharacterized protein F5147DRAFT_677789 [Suillus discolor]|uniref:Uncharacterized protein n=1 Tax=Suillus discolor TaxID=1912936 RepID=A0A9P7JXT0_9AGAM|nr:uncharacterized protein F5147DRAFT_677789 [Suillus discolor]KAG2114748.1 hypothetical protein F5147DRAFT_677789 [Suillus discolor]